jgi:peptidoglycan/xylan/chitin deacetylase (PgdA/CDA1 family)
MRLPAMAVLAAAFVLAYHNNRTPPAGCDAARARLSREHLELMVKHRERRSLQQLMTSLKIKSAGDERALETGRPWPVPPDTGESIRPDTARTVTPGDLNAENLKIKRVIPGSPGGKPERKPAIRTAAISPAVPAAPPEKYRGNPEKYTPVSAMPVFCGLRSDPRICLTFDSGEVKGDTYYYHRILDLLVNTNTPATFFLTGAFIKAYPGITKRIARTRLFEMGNHSFTHPDLTARSDKDLHSEIHETQEIMYSVTGKRGRLFRAPYGKIDGRVAAAAARIGLRSIQWDVSAEDFRDTASAGSIAARVLGGVRNGSIIIMHINGRSGPVNEALGDIIRELKRRKFVFVTVSSLLRTSARI